MSINTTLDGISLAAAHVEAQYFLLVTIDDLFEGYIPVQNTFYAPSGSQDSWKQAAAVRFAIADFYSLYGAFINKMPSVKQGAFIRPTPLSGMPEGIRGSLLNCLSRVDVAARYLNNNFPVLSDELI